MCLASVRSLGVGSYIIASEPSPLPESPWQLAQYSLKTGLAALRLASEAGSGFLRSLSSRGTFQGVLWRAARPIERKMRAMTRAKRSLRSVFGFLGGVVMFYSLIKFSHRRGWAGSGNWVGRRG